MRGRKLIAPVLLAVVLVVGAACGDDSKGVSKADYLVKAKEICQKGNEALTAASTEAVSKVPPGQKLALPDVEEFVRKTVVPTIRDQVKQLRGIEAPKGEQAHVEEIYTELDKGLDELEKTPAKLTDGSNVFATADTLAQKYGISVCRDDGTRREMNPTGDQTVWFYDAAATSAVQKAQRLAAMGIDDRQ